MVECDALCTRLAVLMDGQLLCIGQTDELKQHFGVGCNIQLKLNPEKSRVEIDDIKKEIEEALKCELVDESLVKFVISLFLIIKIYQLRRIFIDKCRLSYLIMSH